MGLRDKRTGDWRWLATVGLLAVVMGACSEDSEGNGPGDRSRLAPGFSGCTLVTSPQGSPGTVGLSVTRVTSGLEVPWAIGFLPGGDALVSERPGRIRLITGGSLQSTPVVTLDVGEDGEGGLLGLAVDPRFSDNRAFYVYYTADATSGTVNRLARYQLSANHVSASLTRVMIDDIPAGTFHNGGRLRFGPDGALYVGTGDGRDPERSQDPESLAGKILRISPDATSASDAEIFISGIRNTQGFDWWNPSTLIVSDHGPTGELGLSGRDEISVASQGSNLGWPRITACQGRSGMVTPFVAWQSAMPPGGLIVSDGGLLPTFQNSLLVTSLGASQLMRIDPAGAREIYLKNQFGRLRDIVRAPDGSVWITTSNCDGRGTCGADKDLILRVTEAGL